MTAEALQGLVTADRHPAPGSASRWEWPITGAFVCGAICSGVLRWPLGEWSWVVLWFLADVALGAMAGAAEALRWAYDAARPELSPPPIWRLPYARPGSPAERMARMGRLLGREWRDAGHPALFGVLALAAALPLLSLLPHARLSLAWLVSGAAIVAKGLAAGKRAAPLIMGLRAVVAWLFGYGIIGGSTDAILVIAGLIGVGLCAARLVEHGRTSLARWSGRAAAWGLAGWAVWARQPFLVSWVAAAALYWEMVVGLGRGPALYAWRLGWLTIMLLVAVAFRLGVAPA